jgi:hypothetical protein
MIDDIIQDENVHVKFVDALLNLIARVINLQVTSRIHTTPICSFFSQEIFLNNNRQSQTMKFVLKV